MLCENISKRSILRPADMNASRWVHRKIGSQQPS